MQPTFNSKGVAWFDQLTPRERNFNATQVKRTYHHLAQDNKLHLTQALCEE